MFSPATLFKLWQTLSDFQNGLWKIFVTLDGVGRDLERGDLERESKPLTAEGVVSFKTELRVKKNGSHF